MNTIGQHTVLEDQYRNRGQINPGESLAQECDRMYIHGQNRVLICDKCGGRFYQTEEGSVFDYNTKKCVCAKCVREYNE